MFVIKNGDISCPGCKSKEFKYIDEYKHLIKIDQEYLGNMKIYKCNNCKLGFAYSFPDASLLNTYYKEIYRKSNRPHYLKDPKKSKPGSWQMACM